MVISADNLINLVNKFSNKALELDIVVETEKLPQLDKVFFNKGYQCAVSKQPGTDGDFSRLQCSLPKLKKLGDWKGIKDISAYYEWFITTMPELLKKGCPHSLQAWTIRSLAGKAEKTVIYATYGIEGKQEKRVYNSFPLSSNQIEREVVKESSPDGAQDTFHAISFRLQQTPWKWKTIIYSIFSESKEKKIAYRAQIHYEGSELTEQQIKEKIEGEKKRGI